MTERWDVWMALLAQRDSALLNLAGMALVIVIAWEALDRAPMPWRRWLRALFLITPVIVLYVSLFLTMEAEMGTALLIAVGVMLLVIAFGAVRIYLRVRREKESEQK